MAGFNYTAAVEGKLGGNWTFDALNKWLTKPSAVAPGTAMTFAGLSNEKQRADVIAYLNTLSPNPVPLPTAQGAAAPAAKRRPAPASPAAVRRATRQLPPRPHPAPPLRLAPLRPNTSGLFVAVSPVVALSHGDAQSISSRRTPARWRRSRKGR